MGKFHIGTPAGYDVEVNAKDQSEALSIAKEKWQTLPRVLMTDDKNGRVLEQNGKRFFVSPGFSTADPDQINQIMQGASAGEISSKSFDEQAIAAAPAAARATKFVEGVPFVGSFVDEALGSALGPDARAGIRAQSAAMERQRPGQSLGLQMAGGVATGGASAAALPAATLPTAAASLRTLSGAIKGGLLGAGLGAAEGAVSGFGRGTSDEGRAQTAAEGATFGGVAGGALGAAAPLMAKAADNVIGLFRRTDIAAISQDLGISKDAARVIKNTFEQGGDMQAALDNVARAGDQGMLADAGQAGQALLDAAANSGGTGAQIARGAIDDRAAASSVALDRVLDDVLGPVPVGPQTAIKDIAKRSSSARSEAFESAFSQAVDFASPSGAKVQDALGRIPPKVLNEAIDEANEALLEAGQSANMIRAAINDKGEVVLDGVPNVQQLHEIKVALNGLADGAKGDFGAATAKSRRYSNLSSRLRSALGEAVPDYNRAVQLGGDKIAEQNAFGLGASLLDRKTNLEDIALELGDSPSLAQVAAAKAGLRGAISKALGDVRAIASDPNMDARQLGEAFRILSSDNSRAKIKALLGKDAGPLIKVMDEAEQTLLVRAATARGSQTAPRQAVVETVKDITAPGLMGTAARGEPIDASKRLVQAVTGMTDEFTAAQRQQVFLDIQKALTEKKGGAARAALNDIARAMQGQQITEAQTAKIAKELVDAGFVAGTLSGTRALQAEQERLR